MKVILTKPLIIFLIIIFYHPDSFNQNPPVSFEFNWTSGELIEVVAKSSKSGSIMVQFIDYPQEFDTVNKVIKLDDLTITSSIDFNPSDTFKLFIYDTMSDSTFKIRADANKSITFSPAAPELFLDSTKIFTPTLQEPFYIIAMKNHMLYKMQVYVSLTSDSIKFNNNNKDTVSMLRVIRYPFKGKTLTYLEDEGSNIIDVFTHNFGKFDSTTRKNIPDVTAIDSVQIKLLRNCRARQLKINDIQGLKGFADTLIVKNILPLEYGNVSVKYKNPRFWAQETPMYSMKVSEKGESNYVLLNNFNLISNGGRIKIRYKWNSDKEFHQTTGIVLERSFLGIEMGSIFNINEKGKPIAKFEYSLLGTSVLGSFWDGVWDASANFRFTSMRIPAKFSSQNLPQIGDIIESKLQIAYSLNQKEWEANRFSFISYFSTKSNNLNDSSDIAFYGGIGLGCRLNFPIFNEKRPKEEYGRSAGSFSLSFAWDNFWEHMWRLVSEFRIDVFKIASNSIIFSLGGKIDGPLGFSGPADVRLSILGTLNTTVVSKLLDSFK